MTFVRETMTQERAILVPRGDRGPWGNGAGDEKGVRRITLLFIAQYEWRALQGRRARILHEHGW